MQLNNLTNNHIVVIEKKRFEYNSVNVSEYENYICLQQKNAKRNWNIGLTIDMNALTSTSTNIEQDCYNNLLTMPEFSDYVLSNDTRNWVFDGVDGRSLKPIRITTTDKFSLNHIFLEDAMGMLILRVNTENKDTILFSEDSSDKWVVSYFSQVLEGDNDIISEYISKGHLFIETIV